VAANAVSTAAFDAARHDLQAAQQAVSAMQQQIANILATSAAIPISPPTSIPWCCRRSHRGPGDPDLAHAVVYAPMDGVVSKVDKPPVGQYLSVGTTAFLADLQPGLDRGQFQETDLTHMRAGDTATVSVDTYPGHEFEAGCKASVLAPARSSRSCRRRTPPGTG